MAGRVLPRQPFLVQDRLDPRWEQYLRSLLDVPEWLGVAEVVDQAAAIASTPIVVVGRLAAGIYRISYYARITRAAGISSSLTVRFNWTDGSVAQFELGAAMIGNTTATVQQNRLMVRVDRDTSITYETGYASVGVPTMQYSLRIALERLQ